MAPMSPQLVLRGRVGSQDDWGALGAPIADLSVYQKLRDQAPDNVPIFGISNAAGDVQTELGGLFVGNELAVGGEPYIGQASPQSQLLLNAARV